MEFVKGIVFSDSQTSEDAVLHAFFCSSSVSFDVGGVFARSKRIAATSIKGIFAREGIVDETLMGSKGEGCWAWTCTTRRPFE